MTGLICSMKVAHFDRYVIGLDVSDKEIIPSSIFEPRHEKTNVLVSDLVRHKPGYAVTEDG